MTGDVSVTSLHGDIVLTEESGWIETDGRIVLTRADIDLAGVIKNATAPAPEPAPGVDPVPANYEVVIAPSHALTLTGDVDAFGLVLITVPTAFTLQGSVEAGGVETFVFLTEERGFLDNNTSNDASTSKRRVLTWMEAQALSMRPTRSRGFPPARPIRWAPRSWLPISSS